jgi:hypothetical protein
MLVAGWLDVDDQHAVRFVHADDLQFHTPVVTGDPYPLVTVLLGGGDEDRLGAVDRSQQARTDHPRDCGPVALHANLGDDGTMAGASVTVIMGLIALWYLSTHGKGTAPGRLVAWLLLLVVGWFFIAVQNPAAARSITNWSAEGAVGAVTGVSHFLADVFAPPK